MRARTSRAALRAAKEIADAFDVRPSDARCRSPSSGPLRTTKHPHTHNCASCRAHAPSESHLYCVCDQLESDAANLTRVSAKQLNRH